jgi:cysteine desulfurase
MGLDPADAQGGLRISLGIVNTEEDVEGFLEVFPGIVNRLRDLSPLKES